MRSGIASSTAAKSRRAHADRRRRPRVHRRARGDRAASQRTGAQRHRRCVTRVLGRASGRGLRHGVRRDRTRGLNVCGPADLARGLGYPALRVPRALGAVVLGASTRAAWPLPSRSPSGRLSPRRGLLGDGGPRRALGRHDNGVLTARGVPMATRSGSIDPGALLFVQRAHGLSVDDVDRTLMRSRGSRVCPEEEVFVRSRRRLGTTSRRSRSVCTPTASREPWRRWLPQRAVSTRSSSPQRGRALGARPSGRMRTPRLSRRRARSRAQRALDPDSDVATSESAVRVLVIAARESSSSHARCERSSANLAQ